MENLPFSLTEMQLYILNICLESSLFILYSILCFKESVILTGALYEFLCNYPPAQSLNQKLGAE